MARSNDTQAKVKSASSQTAASPVAVAPATKADVRAFLAEISAEVASGKAPTVHTMLALNGMFRLPNAREIFDEALRKEALDLWMKIKSAGLQVLDPPLIFGEPSNASEFLMSDVEGDEGASDDATEPLPPTITHTSHTI